MGLCLFIAGSPYVFVFWWLKFPQLALLAAVCTAMYLTPLWLNSRGHYTLARTIPLASALLSISVVSWRLGVELDLHLALIFLACWPFQMFDVRREALTLVLLVSCILGLFLWIQLIAPVTHLAVGAQNLRALLSVSVVILFGSTLYFFYGRNQMVENELEGSRKQLVGALRAKMDFLSLMSHELRSPLNGVLGGAELLDKESLPEGERELVQAIAESGQQLSQVLECVWDFVSLETETVTLRQDPINLADTLSASLRDVSAEARRKGVELDFLLQADGCAAVLADGQKLQQICRCIAANAVRYTPRGWVFISAKTQLVKGEVILRVEVRDTGPGFAQGLLNTATEAFRQASGIRQRGVEGIGLGLTLSHRLVGLMGGDLTLANHPEEGAVVRWMVRLCPKPQSVETSVAQLPPLPPLYLEISNDRARRSLESILGQLGCPVSNSPLPGGEELTFRECPEVEGKVVASIDLQRGDEHIVRLERPLGVYAVEAALQTAVEQANASAISATATESKLQALLVEDNKINRLVLRRVLTKLGWEVTQAEDGADGVEKWLQGQFDVVVMDIQMPRMDGIEAMAEIRKLERANSSQVPTSFVVVTANATPEQRIDCEAFNVEDYLTKPCSREDLEPALGRIQKRIRLRNKQTEDAVPPWRVLLAEDMETNSKIMTRLLRSANCEVVHVVNGEEAVEQFQQQVFDVIFMDIAMPIMDGVEAIAEIRRLELGAAGVDATVMSRRQIPIVVVTANASAAQRRNAEQLGIQGYLIKPVRVGDCQRVMKNLRLQAASI